MDALTQKTPALNVSGVSCQFGKTKALDDLSATVQAGQIVGLLGRNGAGKSTLLRIISAQLKPDAGKTFIFGKKTGASDALSKLCLIGDSADFGGLSNMKTLFYVCEGLYPAWDNAYAQMLMRRFDLPEKKKLKGFSRGMKTAALLITGLASGAPLTVFDEPSLGLDAVMRERFYDTLIEDKQKNPDRTFILSTHLIDEVARTLDYAILIDAGSLLYEGPVSDLTALYLSVSGADEAVKHAANGHTIIKEEKTAGSVILHLKLKHAEDAGHIMADNDIRCASMSLQRLFVLLVEEKEAARCAGNA